MPPVPEDWFRPDPFPGTGHHSYDGYNYAKLAADQEAGLALGIDDAQRAKLTAVWDKYIEQSRTISAQLVNEFGRLPNNEWKAAQEKIWGEGREAAAAILTEPQQQRIRQLLVQKEGLRAFQQPPLAKLLNILPQVE